MLLEHAKEGMVLAQDVLDERYNLLLEKGLTLTESYIKHLKHQGIHIIYVVDPYAATLKQNPIIAEELREELFDCFHTLFTMGTGCLLNHKECSTHLKRLGTVLDDVIDQTSTHMPNIIDAQIRLPSEDEINHSVNVCLLSVITGLYLKFSKPILQTLALGALMHDLGKCLLPHDSTGIDAGKHTQLGHELLLKTTLNPVIARIAAEHHEYFDGTGYPMHLSGNDIYPLSRLVCITNHFDRAITKATIDDIPRQEIVEKMIASGNTLFDLNILRAFFHSVSIYPVGSIVKLNTGQSGYVIKNHPHFIMRPIVRIVEKSGNTDIDLVNRPNIIITDVIED